MIEVKTNVDAWNLLKDLCMSGYRQNISRGSFENTNVFRMQSYPVMITITDPLNFLDLPKEITLGMIEKYYRDDLINQEKQHNQVYNYGERIFPQIEPVAEMLLKTNGTNQAIISVSRPEDINFEHPPCLREIGFYYFSGYLNMISYWRSNDIGSAFLLNQGGLSMLFNDMCDYAGLIIGNHYYCSPGAHIYDYGV